MILLSSKKEHLINFGIALKLGTLLAVFGILASGFTGYFTYNKARDILADKATQSMLESTNLLGRRFSSMGHKVANEARFLARTQLVKQAADDKPGSVSARLSLSDQFKSLLSVHSEYFQIRLISAHQYGIELVRVDRDGGQLVAIKEPELQEKQHYPYVYKTLKLPDGQAYFSKIFINHEKGAHAGLGQPTLQVATPVVGDDGDTKGVVVINVDLNRMFSILRSDLAKEYQLYLTNQKGDYLIHPDKSKTFGFDHGRKFLAQNTFKSVAQIVNAVSDAVTVRQFDIEHDLSVIGSFARITFGELTDNRFVIIGLTVPLGIVLAESDSLIQNSIRVVVVFSFLALILSVLVARIFVRPVNNLVTVVQRFIDKKELSPIVGYPKDELGLLAGSIGKMQARILMHLDDLSDQNTLLNHEIHERKRIEKYDKFRSHILELLAGNNQLNDILEAIVLGVEQLRPELICSILQLDDEGKHLGMGVAPHLPDFYNAEIDGVEIGVGMGSCGTAAYTKERVIVEDIQTHLYWKNFKDLAASAGLASCWSQPIFSSSGKILGTFAIYQHEISTPNEFDIELIVKSARLVSIAIDRKHAEDEVNNLAFYDPLTRLPNRRLLLDRLNQSLAARAHSKKEVALLFIDLDKFKALNDSLGHDMGDLLLQTVAERITSCVRDSDTVSRLGGDEFVVMLKGLSEQPILAASETESIGKKILVALSETYQLVSHRYNLTPSIGATLLGDSHQNADELFKQADIAMYQSKKIGGNALYFYDPDMQAHLIARVRVETELRDAISKGGQFALYYQPQVNESARVIGAEALIRWISPLRGIISPVDFIPVAEESGLILPLGQWVLATACQQLAKWALHPETAHLTLAVNISARQIRMPSFVEDVLSLVNKSQVNPEKLKLEITESILLDSLEDTIAKMTALKARGIKFSIDDFGTGYSSLQYLKRLPLDQLKIDQSFVQDIEHDSSDRAIVRTIIAMADSLNLDVIAEGVETEKQRELLVNKGCFNYQGYLFSKPIPIESFDAIFYQSANK